MYFCVVLCIFVLFYVFWVVLCIFVLFYVFLCCSMHFCVVLCIVCFVTFSVLLVCKCVLKYCHRVATQLQLNISYHILERNGRCLGDANLCKNFMTFLKINSLHLGVAASVV
jgi:hypothetical protein